MMPCGLASGNDVTRRIEAILFDLGDTLLDFGEIDRHEIFELGTRLAYQ